MFRTLVLTFVVLTLAVTSHAQSPRSASPTPTTTRLIPHWGKAIDVTGSPLTGPVNVTFELYEDRDGGTPLWQETQLVQADSQGRYLAHLGSITPLPQSAFSEERARWFGVTIEGRAQPRAMLMAVPYALRAADAETLGGQPASNYVRSRPDGRLETSEGLVAEAAVEGFGVPGQLAKFSDSTTLSSSVISESASNRIGVGLPDPTGGGVVDSVFTIKNLDNNTGLALLNQSQARRFALNTASDGSWLLYDGGSNTWNAGLRQLNGNVGIGASPDAKLRVIAAQGPGIFATANGPGRHALRGDSPSGSIAILGIVSESPVLDVFANAAVLGYNTTTGTGVQGSSSAGDGIVGASTSGNAGRFYGNVVVSGTLSKGGGSFRIDHPLDPTNKYLQHSFVESPDMLNVYNGNATLDANGEAWVAVPDWFEALNRDFRYQLTSVGAPAPNLHVAEEVADHRFRIAGGAANGRVSWQVTGIRQDAWANAHRIAVELDKPESERGTYLHPEAFGQPATMGLGSPLVNGATAPRKPEGALKKDR